MSCTQPGGSPRVQAPARSQRRSARLSDRTKRVTRAPRAARVPPSATRCTMALPTTTPSASGPSSRACAGEETPKPITTGTGLCSRTAATAAPISRGDRPPGAGHAGHRDEVEEPVAARAAASTRAASEVGASRKTSVTPRGARRASELAGLLGEEVGDDERVHAGAGAAVGEAARRRGRGSGSGSP